jgi:hypothetical protein
VERVPGIGKPRGNDLLVMNVTLVAPAAQPVLTASTTTSAGSTRHLRLLLNMISSCCRPDLPCKHVPTKRSPCGRIHTLGRNSRSIGDLPRVSAQAAARKGSGEFCLSQLG